MHAGWLAHHRVCPVDSQQFCNPPCNASKRPRQMTLGQYQLVVLGMFYQPSKPVFTHTTSPNLAAWLLCASIERVFSARMFRAQDSKHTLSTKQSGSHRDTSRPLMRPVSSRAMALTGSHSFRHGRQPLAHGSLHRRRELTKDNHDRMGLTTLYNRTPI